MSDNSAMKRKQNEILKPTLLVALGEALVAALCVLVYALIGKYKPAVLWGALTGALLAVVNYLIMAVSATKAAQKAVSGQDIAAAQTGMRLSYILRIVLIFALLAVAVKTGFADPIAAIIPLLLMQPIIILAQQRAGKAGDR